MSNPLSALNFAAFSLGGTDMLALLKTFSFQVENIQVDGAGLADRYPQFQTVKQSQSAEFTVFVNGSGGLRASNLDISLWSIGGTAYLGTIRRGKIEATTEVQDRSGIADAYLYPNATRTKVEVTTEKLVVGSAALTGAMMTGTVASFNVTAAITFGATVFSCPMTLRAVRHTIERNAMQLEDVVMTWAGTPTGPSDSSLLGNILLGTALVTLSANTGGGTYATGTGQTALIQSLTASFRDAAIIEMVGHLEMQGGAGWTAP